MLVATLQSSAEYILQFQKQRLTIPFVKHTWLRIVGNCISSLYIYISIYKCEKTTTKDQSSQQKGVTCKLD